MPAPNAVSTPPEELGLETLVAECIEHVDEGRDIEVAGVCDRHPELADALRERLDQLRARGLLRRARIDEIGPYKILRPLGRGGMGEVFLAEQSEPVRRLVALKWMLDGLAEPSALARFEAERQALAMMEHPGIAGVHDAGTTDDGRPYFVMEYVPGAPLTEFCDERRLSPSERLELFGQVCDAVHHAHQHGVIHRDLKPTNVLVRELDGQPAPKVIDFGLAKALDEPLTERTLVTHEGQLIGTPAYMSPEQSDGQGRGVDVRTDVYALGVMLYELTTGLRPFEDSRLQAGGVLEMLRILRDEEPPSPSSRLSRLADADVAELAKHQRTTPRALARAVRGELDWITGKAIAKRPQERYASVSELAADLQRHLAGEPVLAGPPTAIYRVRKLVARHRAAFAAGALVFAGLVVALIVILQLMLGARENLRKFDRLADSDVIARLQHEAEVELWPAHPMRIAAMERWLVRARPFADPGAIARVEGELEAHRTTGLVDDETGEWRFETRNAGVLHQGLVGLADAMRTLAGDDGTVMGIERRLAWARSLEQRTIEAHADAWRRTIEEIRAEHGIRMEPIIGLVPLGPDPTSGLHEFALAEPHGSIPQRNDAGHVQLADERDCIVLVLLPGGEFTIGSQKDDPDAPYYDPLFNVQSTSTVREVTLSPFMVSKFEITQAQWQRTMGSNPSRFQRRENRQKEADMFRIRNALHPVESVSFLDCVQFCERLGLEIPHRAQWEHAARGETDTPWWTGESRKSIHFAANIGDKSRRDRWPLQAIDFEDYEDGWPIHAPVGTFHANRFGLHDVAGNVWEWCLRRGSWPLEPEAYEIAHRWRGGSWVGDALSARIASTRNCNPSMRHEACGLRPILTL